jgi:hypothetical protein
LLINKTPEEEKMALEETNSNASLESAPVPTEQTQTSGGTPEESEILLQRIKDKYQRKQEHLEDLKVQEKKMRAAKVLTKRRYREVSAALKKGGNMVSDAALAAQMEGVKLLDKAKAQTRIFNLNRKIDELLGQLGSEIYDLVALGGTSVFDNANIKKILARLNECNVEIELINKKLADDGAGTDS